MVVFSVYIHLPSFQLRYSRKVNEIWRKQWLVHVKYLCFIRFLCLVVTLPRTKHSNWNLNLKKNFVPSYFVKEPNLWCLVCLDHNFLSQILFEEWFSNCREVYSEHLPFEPSSFLQDWNNSNMFLAIIRERIFSNILQLPFIFFSKASYFYRPLCQTVLTLQFKYKLS